MTFAPYPDQVKDLETLRENNYTGMLNIQTGGGKTALTAFAIRDSGASSVLISAPTQTMKSAWIPTIADIVGVEAREIGNRNKKMQQALADYELGYPGVYLVTPQLLARKGTNKSLWTGDTLVVDESHELMSPGKIGQRTLSGYTPAESEKALARKFGSRLTLSGTMLRNRFEYAWSYGRFLWWWLDGRDEIAYLNHYVWKQDRMDTKEVVTGFDWIPFTLPEEVPKGARTKKIEGQWCYGKTSSVTTFTTESEPGRWINEAPCVITHLKREGCCEFHPEGFLDIEEPTVVHEVVELSAAQKKAMRELEKMEVTWLEEHPLVTEIPLTREQRIRQIALGVPTLIPTADGDYEVTFAEDCESPFLDRVINILDTKIEGETCVVWTDSQRFASVMTARLNKAKIEAFEYSGQTRSRRDEDLTEFGSRFRVMVGVIAAGGSGLDGLQHVCKNEIYVSRSLDETLNEQSEGRNDRRGQTRQVMRWILHDDLGLSEGRYGDAIAKRLELNKSLRRR